MGLFDRLLGRDPSARLEKAEGLLSDDPRAAVELVGKLAEDGEEPYRSRAAEIRARGVELRLVEVRSKAGRSEAEGHFEDAAEWLRFAFELPLEESTREELEARIRDLERRADARALEEMEERAVRGPEVDPDLPDDPEQAFEVLAGMLDDDISPRYLEAGGDEAFRAAFLALHEGRSAAALATLDELVESRPDVAVFRLERARARLVEEDARGAREDLEAVWETFGDEPLDLAQSLSIPGLWAEAMLELGEVDALLDRLDGVADPRYGDPGLCVRYARALLDAGRLDAAETFLESARSTFAGEPTFPWLLAQVRRRLGKRRQAIEVLERAIAPSCASGRCGAPGKHLPSFRLLVELHLEEEAPESRERVATLLNHLTHAQGGALPASDLRLLAAHHAAAGREEAAREAADRAAALEAEGGGTGDRAAPGGVAEPPPLTATNDRVL